MTEESQSDFRPDLKYAEAVREYQRRAQEILKREPKPKTVYHYTKFENLVPILTEGELRATHTAYMNDPTELVHGLDVCDAILREFSETTDGTLNRLAQAAYASFKDAREDTRHDTFAVSFTDVRDAQLQWHAYGNNGLGVAIGFDFELLIQNLTHADNEGKVAIDDENPVIWWSLAGLEYDAARQADIVKSLLSEAKVVADACEEDDQTLEGNVRNFSNYIQSLIVRISKTFKQPALFGEHEWRAIPQWILTESREHVKFRAGSRGLIPFVEMPFTSGIEGVPSPITEIVLGSALDEQSSKLALAMLFESKNAHVGPWDYPTIAMSEVRLRMV